MTDRGPYERGVTLRFKARAASRYANVPARDDTLGWLTLMQHYHLPTRCLDWTESPLVGLYFAVSDSADDKVDGVLWALDPFRLNECLWGKSGTLAPEMPALARLFDVLSGDALVGYPTSVGQADVAALTPAQSDLRTLVQMSCFTVHANGAALEGQPESERFLRRVTIDAQSKRAIRRSLKEAGFSESQLFPDLEHLAREEAARCFCQKQPCPHSAAP